MKKGLTEIVFILDESGSMCPLKSDTIGGFNSLIEKQRNEEGEVIVSAVMFSNTSRVVYDRVKLEDVAEMTGRDYCPSGCTALFDAIGSSVKHIGNVHKYARDEDVPEHTLFIITTDGMENASRHFSSSKVKKMIEKQKEKYGWDFVFLGANIDAAETAENIGIDRESAVDYNSDAEGTQVMFSCLSAAVTNSRHGVKSCESKNWRKMADKNFRR